MKCPYCGKEIKYHKKLPELNDNQKRTINFCKEKPRYMYEINNFLFDGNCSRQATTRSCVNSLLNRGLLFKCENIINDNCSDGRSKRRKDYYLSKKPCNHR